MTYEPNDFAYFVVTESHIILTHTCTKDQGDRYVKFIITPQETFLAINAVSILMRPKKSL